MAVTADGSGGWLLPLDDDGAPAQAPRQVADLAASVAEIEAAQAPRWVLADTAELYPPLLRAGVRLGQCHDVSLIEAILISRQGQAGHPHHLAAAHARIHQLPIPERVTAVAPRQATLFDDDSARPDARAELDVLAEVFADQRARMTADESSVRLLVAAESAGALIAAEMTHVGLPWRVDIHDAVLADLVGPRPVKGMRPKKLQAIADQIAAAFDHPFNPDSPQQVLAAFRKAGHPIETTRAWELKTIDHPAVPPLLRYKELSRVHSAHGWNWLSEWVGDGPGGPDSPAKRFRPRYVVGGVVTGRWATDGGAALQIPKVIRAAATADAGHKLVVADAAQLEPRMLAAMSQDPGMIAAAEADDMYAALAPTFDGSRDDAKIALLSAMYGGTAGNATALLTVMRRRFPTAYAYVEQAARDGEKGGLVRTWLGRTSPAPGDGWWNALTGPGGTRSARDRGRFTRNFVVQGTAAEWALSMMALLRSRLWERELGDLVFFQHDEIIVHCEQSRAETVAGLIQECADQATRLLFGRLSMRVPLSAAIVDSYDKAK
ncbi:bifunctional 3'-5' exonuclease/DNA polymerase [Stackebrandtia nassauensis]|uniref:DNA-directed DNA polymerase n=1 Tax=Stackebrandtia nassauensis (strain DSM 44728 / CIP 108903 / NRRL B-16338 / NBRC 102104 / LLR-40K-21) TaxID=446470 RepID=D3Q3Y5_STANL|nr:bifunctional 3'-5' exonuclease/DNA polymerase [Stackebrandtia nassauensis]ADD44052.1 DNA-directed DNA polymerase [Stackebrandtia nassauensis DSM 44728]